MEKELLKEAKNQEDQKNQEDKKQLPVNSRTKQNPRPERHCQLNGETTPGHHPSRTGPARCQTQRLNQEDQ